MWDRKIYPEDHRLALHGLPSDDKRDCEGQIFLSHPHTNNGFLFLFTTKYRILCFEKLPKVPEYAGLRYMMLSL